MPFSAYRTVVRDEWLDYNGHMHDASYAIVLSDANEALFDALDLSEGYRAAAGAAYYTVETHIRFVSECTQGQRLRATTLLVAADPKRIRLYTEILHDDQTDDSSVAATGDSLYLHVDSASGRVTTLPDERWEPVRRVLDAHRAVDRPPTLGLGVGIRPGDGV